MSDYISEDTVAVILKYFPVRSLLRFRCVCKGWRELIDSPAFMHDHLAVQNPRFIANCPGHGFGFLSFDLHTHPPSVDTLIPPIIRRNLMSIGMLGTLHGVVCITNWDRKLMIWNPSIRKRSVVTLPDHFPREDYFIGWHHYYGFWIDPSTKEFKILISLFFLVHGDDGWIEDKFGILYSSAQNDWRVLPPEDSLGWRTKRFSDGEAPVMIGEVAHWIGWHGVIDDQGVEQVSDAILSFDFRLESFELIKIPSSNSVRSIPCSWQGMLSFMQCDDEVSPRRWDIYSRQEGNSWVKVFSYDYFSPTKPDVLPLESLADMHEKIKLSSSCLVKFAYDFVESLLFP